MIILRDYQEKYIDRLKNNVNDLVNTGENEICIFQAPTGSGKTIMVAEFMKRLITGRDDNKKFSFIWVSVRKLHNQSKESLERYYEEGRSLKCSSFSDLSDKKIDENEILFINWESMNKKDKNTIIKENEQDFYLEAVINNTKEEGREIIMVIDESHHTATSEKSKELINIISPNVTIEVSATPHLREHISSKIKVPLNEVKEQEIIKKEVAINPEFKNLKITSKNEDETVIKQALEKRDELANLFKKEKSNINPLVLIQLPDRKQLSEDKKKKVEQILKKFKITEENGKLAIWLSEQKSETLANVEKEDNDVEVLIFKQAIALGWDCPRADILVIFREYKSFEFTIQTIGRIMRMPERRHYNEEELNKGFIFTNLSQIIIEEDYAKDYLTTYESKRNNKLYNKVDLPSIHFRRQREKTRLSGEFIKIFQKVAKEQKLKGQIKLNPSKLKIPIITDGVIEDIDKTGKAEQETFNIGLSDTEVFYKFNEYIRKLCSPFAPYDSSDRMKRAIYSFFNKEFGIAKLDPKIQRIVLGDENALIIAYAIIQAKNMYIEHIKKLKEKREINENKHWEVPLVLTYTKKGTVGDYKKSVMEPLYLRKKTSTPEDNFMKTISKSKKVKCWFKNGESESKFFAVYYKDEKGEEKPFYVDFIILFNDGKIGLFDTKKGRTAEEAGPRAKGLYNYIQAQNKKGRELIGGILIESSGAWLWNDGKDYDYDNLSKWKVLEI